MQTLEIPENIGKPVRGRILVRRAEDIKVTLGGIHVPEKARERLNEGYVLAVSELVINEHGFIIEHICEVGDRIVFGKYAGLEVTIDKNEYTVMNETEVLMILPPKSEEQIAEEARENSLLISLSN